MRTREKAFQTKIITENMRLRRTLVAIVDTATPPNPFDAMDRLDRVKRRAVIALRRR